jgi:hypothetical protein
MKVMTVLARAPRSSGSPAWIRLLDKHAEHVLVHAGQKLRRDG